MDGNAFLQRLMPHGTRYWPNPSLLALHVMSDAIIALAYYAIALILLFFVRKRHDLPFRTLFAVFVVFIVACGTTHVFDIWTIWHPTYWLSAAVEVVAAAVSLATVALLVQIVPQALALRSPTTLDAINRQLALKAENDRATAASLREKNRLMAMAESMAHVGHWRLDLISSEQYWSDEVYRTYGLPTTTLPTLDDAIRAYHPDDRTQVKSLVEAAIAAGTPFTHQSRIVRPDGTIRYIVSSGQVECAPDGNAIAVFGVFQDVTDAKNEERERERLIERIKVATQGAHVGIWEWDIVAGKVFWDPIMFALYGFDNAQFTPTFETWAASLHDEDRSRVEREIANAMRGSTVFNTEFRVVWPNGELHNILSTASLICNPAGIRERMIGTNLDVTEVRTLAEMLRKEKDAATFAATHDTLTGLLNRRGLEAWVQSRPTLVATLLYLDIDDFKIVNDRGGHDAGDDTLRVVARIIGHAVRECDGAARIGGDEFIILLVNTQDIETTRSVIARITSAVGALCPLGAGDDTRIGISIGIGHLAYGGSFREALHDADIDLYRRKSERHLNFASDLSSGRTGSVTADRRSRES